MQTGGGKVSERSHVSTTRFLRCMNPGINEAGKKGIFPSNYVCVFSELSDVDSLSLSDRRSRPCHKICSGRSMTSQSPRAWC